jgi:CP family cyanate transporter-like MFS transporter
MQWSNNGVQSSNKSKRETILLALGIVFVAANMRAPITAVGPLLDQIRSSLQLNNTLAGMLTTFPLLAFAFFSPLAPGLSRRYGMKAILLWAVVILTFGILLRSWSGSISLFLGTALVGIAISICNVLIPSLIKQDFPDRIGIMTGVFSVSMSSFGAVGSGLSFPIAAVLGWPAALRIWAALSILASIAWLPQALREGRRKSIAKTATDAGRNAAAAADTKINLWKSPLAWQVTFYTGLQSLIFYCLIAWLPDILLQKGVDPQQAGFMLSSMQITSIPVIFLGSLLAGQKANHRTLVIVSILCYITGFSGMLISDGAVTYVWTALFGIAGGLTFGLTMMYFTLRTRTSQEAAQLSGMAQSVGYLLAAVGPMLFGYLREALDNWRMPVYILIVVASLCLLFGVFAARDRYVS